jgi:site-specific DNA-cytosine methylase
MNVLSLFDGISCGQVALNRAGVPYDRYFSSEIDRNAIKITQSNYPNTRQMGDITKLKSSMLPRICLLMGGSPCQSFSPAISSNTGFDGKSKLFFEFIRLLDECDPKYFFLENVVMKKEWRDIITRYMGVEPIEVNSRYFCAQDRPRLYWTNIPFKVIFQNNETVLGDILESNVPAKYFYNESFEYVNQGAVEALLHINGHDILKRVNSKNEKCQCLTAVCGGNQQKKVIDNGRVRKLTPVEYERLQTLPDNYTAAVSDSARYKAIGNGWTVDVIAHFFKSFAGITERLKVHDF